MSNNNAYNCIMLFMLYKQSLLCICKLKQCAKEGHPCSWGWWVITPKCVWEKRRGLHVLKGFPPNFSIFETHVHIVSKHSASLWRNVLYFSPILLLGFLTETNTERPIDSVSVFQTGNMSWMWQMTTLSCSLSLCFPIVVPSPPPLYHQRHASLCLWLLFKCHRQTTGGL